MAARIGFLLTFFLLVCSAASDGAEPAADSYVRDACSVTKYRNICIRSLSSFSNIAKNSPSKWARAGVSVTLLEVKNVLRYITRLKKNGRVTRMRNRIALLDCIECFQNAIDELHQSLGVLRRLNARNFETQMSDLTTWLSATLTDEDTCLDGYENQRGKRVTMLRNRVLNATYITSNALALVNKLATSGVGSLTDDP